ncbi:MAG: serine O-acetyltransferase [Defluviitaleaceae bacterium]|nr:serine O-acetyltransferase [Defluviitaleaceae bacterium]MCL2239707.1 serine O-acetyltransferase [Defluviitaleaceae bacterium]
MIKRVTQLIKRRDPSLRTPREAWLYPGIWALFYHRAAHALYNKKHFFTARLVAAFSRWVTGIEIHPGAQIGRGVFIDHGMGVVIGETCTIGNDVLIYHGVTLGATGKERGKKQRHPMVGNHVVLGAGAIILGPLTIGHHAKIGAGAVVVAHVPPHTTVVSDPARNTRKECSARKAINDLHSRIESLENRGTL